MVSGVQSICGDPIGLQALVLHALAEVQRRRWVLALLASADQRIDGDSVRLDVLALQAFPKL